MSNPPLLTRTAFSIMLALSLKQSHGYALLSQIQTDSNGLVTLGPGGLYGTLKLLTEENLVEEIPFADNPRQKHYRLTKKGWDRLTRETEHYAHIVRLARERHVLPIINN